MSGVMSRAGRCSVGRTVVEAAQRYCTVGQFEVQWEHEGAKNEYYFRLDGEAGASMGTATPGASEGPCPDCNGTKQYVGLYTVTPCYTCQGGGPA